MLGISASMDQLARSPLKKRAQTHFPVELRGRGLTNTDDLGADDEDSDGILF
jgi:hypothetical protein